MANNLNEMTWAAIFGIIGVVVGSVATGLMNAHIQEKQHRVLATLNSFKFDHGNYSNIDLKSKQLIDEVRYLSIASDEAILGLAKIKNKYPECATKLSGSCRKAFVEMIQVMRNELGSGDVGSDYIDIVLESKYTALLEAYNQANR